MSKPVICFDWDGTLCDSMELCVNENRMVLERMSLPAVPVETLRKCNGPTFEEAAPMLGIPPERLDEYCRIRLACALELVPQVNRLFPGVRELLEILRPHARLCIVSNGTAEYIARCMEVFQLQGMFDRTVTCRPDRTKGQNLAALLAELQPEKVCMIGDRLGDIRAGQENGVLTIAACYGYGSDEEFNQADVQIRSVEALTAWCLDFSK